MIKKLFCFVEIKFIAIEMLQISKKKNMKDKTLLIHVYKKNSY